VTPVLSPTRLSAAFGPFGPQFSRVLAPADPPQSVEETWVVRARPLGPSGRVVVEARAHRRGEWLSNPADWPAAVQDLARAERDRQGRAISRRSYDQWRLLSGARAKARRVVEVALRAARALAGPMVAWIEAVAETALGTVRARVRADASPAERAAFLAWAESHTPHRVVRAGEAWA